MSFLSPRFAKGSHRRLPISGLTAAGFGFQESTARLLSPDGPRLISERTWLRRTSVWLANSMHDAENKRCSKLAER